MIYSLKTNHMIQKVRYIYEHILQMYMHLYKESGCAEQDFFARGKQIS